MTDQRDVERLWPHSLDDCIIAEGHDWIAVNKSAGVGERLPLGPDNDLVTRLKMTRNAEHMHVLSPPICGLDKPDVLRDSLSTGVSLIGLRKDTEHLTGPAPHRWRQRWWVGIRLNRRWTAIQSAVNALGARIKLEQQHGERALVSVEVDGPHSSSWFRELRRTCDGLDRFAPREAHDGRSPALREHRPLVHRSNLQVGDLDLYAPVPELMMQWLKAESLSLDAELKEALNRRYSLAKSGLTNAFRILDDERGFTLDYYGGDVVLASYDALPDPTAVAPVLAKGVDTARRQAKEIAAKLCVERMWLKIRPKQANQIIDAARLGLAPSQPIIGDLQSRPQDIIEGGIRYHVHLDRGLSTGIFLDQRDNRLWLQKIAANKAVLNTFSYTCAFSVAAAVGGASRTVSIDAAANALQTGERNFTLNGFEVGSQHDLIRGDVFQWLPKLAKRGERFDIIVLDPPSYAKVKGRRFSASRDYAMLVDLACRIAAPRAVLLCSLNHAKVSRSKLEKMVRKGCQEAKRGILHLHHQAPALDHPSARMKAIRLQLDNR